MKQLLGTGVALVIALLGAAAPALAHHSLQSEYDIDKSVTLQGTVTKVDWVNPHIVLAMETKGEGGKVEQWKLESNPPSWYKSVGLARADLAKAIGQQITVECVKARDGSLYGYMDKIKLPDGTSYELVNGNEAK